jgi:16S rRNA (guanine966-N2)-methyltransferase
MRIIAGKAGGIKLKSIKTKKVRPTLDRVKEALFSMLLPYMPREKGLDLFAGFGTLGLEAVSRGVNSMTFVEKNRRHVKIIEENIDKCKFNEMAEVVQDDVFKFLKSTEKKYDLVFLDPPYNKNLVNKTLNSLLDNCLLHKGSLIIVEHHKGEIIEDIEQLIVIKDRNYNDTVIKVYLYEEE